MRVARPTPSPCPQRRTHVVTRRTDRPAAGPTRRRREPRDGRWTPQTNLALLLLLLEVVAEFYGMLIGLLGLLVGVRRLADDAGLDALLLVGFFGELFRVVQSFLGTFELGGSKRLLVVGIIWRGSRWRRRLRLQFQLGYRHGHQVRLLRRLRRALVPVTIHKFVVPVFPYGYYLVDRRRVVPWDGFEVRGMLVIVLFGREGRTSKGQSPSRRKRMTRRRVHHLPVPDFSYL